jgi:hypothetical protein
MFDEAQFQEIRRGDEYDCKETALWGTLIRNSGKTELETPSIVCLPPPVVRGVSRPSVEVFFRERHNVQG